MKTQERQCGDVVVLDLHGTLAPRAVAVELWDSVRALARRGHHKLILNLADLKVSSPFAASTLIGALLEARQAGTRVTLLHATRCTNDLSLLVALYHHVEVFEREQDALASFGAAGVQPVGQDPVASGHDMVQATA